MTTTKEQSPIVIFYDQLYVVRNCSIRPVLRIEHPMSEEFRDRFKTWEQLKTERYLC